MSKRKHVLKWFWAWNDHAEELWLESMARQGWHLASGPLLYGFDQGEPTAVRYRLDYRTSSGPELSEYVKLCRDAGWERVLVFGGWQYFRTASPDAPEIYTDAASKIAKYQRLFRFAALLAVITLSGNLPTLFRSPGRPEDAWVGTVSHLGVVALIALWVAVLARLAYSIRKMKRELH